MSQKLPVNDFKWVEEIFKFDETLYKVRMKKGIKDICFELDIQYPEILHNLRNDLAFPSERMTIEKFEKLVRNVHYI